MKSKNISKIKIALAIPFAVAFIFFFASSSDLVKASEKTNHETQIVSVDDTTVVEKKKIEVYTEVEKMAKFQGKKPDDFRIFITENLKYPEEAQKNSIAGRVFVSFIIDKEGNLINAEVVRGAHPLLDAEALRVTNLSPKWEPAENKGKKVNVQFTFPINFALQEK